MAWFIGRAIRHLPWRAPIPQPPATPQGFEEPADESGGLSRLRNQLAIWYAMSDLVGAVVVTPQLRKASLRGAFEWCCAPETGRFSRSLDVEFRSLFMSLARVLAVAIAGACVGCGGAVTARTTRLTPAVPAVADTRRVQASVLGVKELAGRFRVSEVGRIALPLVRAPL